MKTTKWKKYIEEKYILKDRTFALEYGSEVSGILGVCLWG